MNDKERKRIRDLQDKLLAHPGVQLQIINVGEDAPIFGGFGPSANEMRTTLFPELESVFNNLLDSLSD